MSPKVGLHGTVVYGLIIGIPSNILSSVVAPISDQSRTVTPWVARITICYHSTDYKKL